MTQNIQMKLIKNYKVLFLLIVVSIWGGVFTFAGINEVSVVANLFLAYYGYKLCLVVFQFYLSKQIWKLFWIREYSKTHTLLDIFMELPLREKYKERMKVFSIVCKWYASEVNDNGALEEVEVINQSLLDDYYLNSFVSLKLLLYFKMNRFAELKQTVEHYFINSSENEGINQYAYVRSMATGLYFYVEGNERKAARNLLECIEQSPNPFSESMALCYWLLHRICLQEDPGYEGEFETEFHKCKSQTWTTYFLASSECTQI